MSEAIFPPVLTEEDLRGFDAHKRRRLRMERARALGTHTKEQWEALKAEFDYRCVQCERVGYHLDKDHIVPIYLGGSDGLDNLQPLCAWCNAAKGPDSTNWIAYRREHGFEDPA